MTSATGAFTGNDEQQYTWIGNTRLTRSTVRRPLIYVETPSCVGCCCLCRAVIARRWLIVGADLQLCRFSPCYLRQTRAATVSGAHRHQCRVDESGAANENERAGFPILFHNTKLKKPLSLCRASRAKRCWLCWGKIYLPSWKCLMKCILKIVTGKM